jgi:hypothetical protein
VTQATDADLLARILWCGPGSTNQTFNIANATSWCGTRRSASSRKFGMQLAEPAVTPDRRDADVCGVWRDIVARNGLLLIRWTH